jgi:hypothetical protein
MNTDANQRTDYIWSCGLEGDRPLDREIVERLVRIETRLCRLIVSLGYQDILNRDGEDKQPAAPAPQDGQCDAVSQRPSLDALLGPLTVGEARELYQKLKRMFG